MGTLGTNNSLFGLSPTDTALLLSGLTGIAGVIPTPTNTNTSGSGSSTTLQSGSVNSQTTTQQLIKFLQDSLTKTTGTSTTAPNLSPAASSLVDKLIGQYSKLSQPLDLTGYTANQIRNINTNSDINSKVADQILASRGLSTSPISGTVAAGNQQNRMGQISNLEGSIPLLQQQLQTQNLQQAANFAGMLPGLFGQTTNMSQTGQTSTTGTQTASGIQTGSTSSTTGQQTNYNNQQQQQQQQGGGVGAGISGFLSTLMLLLPFL
jgi:hypothetical protein